MFSLILTLTWLKLKLKLLIIHLLLLLSLVYPLGILITAFNPQILMSWFWERKFNFVEHSSFTLSLMSPLSYQNLGSKSALHIAASCTETWTSPVEPMKKVSLCCSCCSTIWLVQLLSHWCVNAILALSIKEDLISYNFSCLTLFLIPSLISPNLGSNSTFWTVASCTENFYARAWASLAQPVM